MTTKRITVWVQRFKDRPAFMLQWTEPDTGRRRSRSARTKDPRAAEKARADLEYELNHGKYQEASRMTWERFRELFEDEYAAGRRANTQRNYRVMFDLFERLCNPARLRSVNERMVSAFATALRQQPGQGGKMAIGTIKVRLQYLRTALNWAVQQKMLPELPRFPAIKLPKKKPQPIAMESFERLLDKAPDVNMRAFLLCGWLAGLRIGEAYALEWEPTDTAPYVDFARDRIILPAAFAKAVEDQWVPLDPVLRAALEALPPRAGKRVFRFETATGRLVGVIAVGHRVTDLARQAGVKLTMRSLRKGFGCRYAAKVPAQVLQKLMRHSNISITMDFYANVDVAVEEAVLGQKRNTSRNSQQTARPVSVSETDENTTGEATCERQ